jgi:cell division protease FtsH
MDGAHQITQLILNQSRELLEETAQLLLEQEVLEGQELKAFLDRVHAPTSMKTWLQTGELMPQPLH